MTSNDECVVTTKANGRKVVWEHDTHLIFIELCLDEIRKGNRPGSHFNKVGWTNLLSNLKERVGKDFTKVQIKNHWDSMKKDWKLFDRLMRIESGLGWDPVRKTIDATPEWWDEKIKAEPAFGKFREKNLEMYHDHYEFLFRDCVATGEQAKTTTDLRRDVLRGGKAPCEGDKDVAGDNDQFNEGAAESHQPNVAGDTSGDEHGQGSTTKNQAARGKYKRTSKRAKTYDPSSFELKLDTVLQAISNTPTFPPVTEVWSITRCMQELVDWPGFESGSPDFNKALNIFRDRNVRECFMIPSTQMDKVTYLMTLL